MRIALAVLVMWWIINLIISMVSHDYFGIALGVLYLSSCAFGCFVRGWIPGLAWWGFVGLGICTLLVKGGASGLALSLGLGGVLFWCAVALIAGNLFRAE